MKQKGTKKIGTFGVREMGVYGEKILHAPKDTKGRFDLSVHDAGTVVVIEGTLVYQPVKP